MRTKKKKNTPRKKQHNDKMPYLTLPLYENNPHVFPNSD